MSKADQQKFIDAVADADSAWVFPDWDDAVDALLPLSMPDMLQALAAITDKQLVKVYEQVIAQGPVNFNTNRVDFASNVVRNHEIVDNNIPLDQVNDGREFLGCTRLDDKGVQFEIDRALNEARSRIQSGKTGPEWPGLSQVVKDCCGAVLLAWTPILVDRRREKKGSSLTANLAAAAHYMLARYHVCAGLAGPGQMKIVIDGYDIQKRRTFRSDGSLDAMALTKGNPPFPVDYAITAWAYKGADHGEADRSRCNPDADVPWVFPTVSGGEK